MVEGLPVWRDQPAGISAGALQCLPGSAGGHRYQGRGRCFNGRLPLYRDDFLIARAFEELLEVAVVQAIGHGSMFANVISAMRGLFRTGERIIHQFGATSYTSGNLQVRARSLRAQCRCHDALTSRFCSTLEMERPRQCSTAKSFVPASDTECRLGRDSSGVVQSEVRIWVTHSPRISHLHRSRKAATLAS